VVFWLTKSYNSILSVVHVGCKNDAFLKAGHSHANGFAILPFLWQPVMPRFSFFAFEEFTEN
jgi:hypothetical protein